MNIQGPLRKCIMCHVCNCKKARTRFVPLQYMSAKKYHPSKNSFYKKNSTTGGILSDPENKGERQQGVNFDTLGSWNNRINMPIAVEKSIKMGKLIPEIPLEEVGVASHMGRKTVNEDRYIVEKISPEILCFGIFDGHGGDLASEYVSQNLPYFIKHWLRQTDDLNEVLTQSFLDINNMLTRHLNFYYIGSPLYNCGTTATVCLLHHGIKLHVAHVGDTRAVLCRESHAVRLTEDHNPDDPREIERITKSGGFIVSNSLGVHQVDGRLSMTRSIGDIELKSRGVIAKPSLKTETLKHGKDGFLILSSDGLNFVLNDNEVVDIVGICQNPKDAATFITDQALQFGTEDNTTVVVVPLGAWGKYRNTTRTIPYSFGRNLVGGRFG
ncbi:protein phosphatase 1K, mitochondrial-like [Saccostrea cucullata]|uniref:protein phosphatase 1K, mitochondrial-like n=1 Tax=Saccostrea cuccullata TaxID=36930 RepID=UPI002ED363A4